MKISLFFLFCMLIGCSKSPLFNTVDNNQYQSLQSLSSQERIGDFNIGLQWIDGPKLASAGESVFKLRFWNSKHSTVYGPYELPSQKVCVFLWMRMPDGSEHGSSPVIVNVEHNDDGDLFIVSDAYFVMNGIWQIRVRFVKESVTCKATKNFDFEREVIFATHLD